MKRILIVDDDPSILHLLSLIVSRQGYEALLACSGPAALELLDCADAVVTDLTMPEMDGLELLRAIRQRYDALPVILVTGYHSESLAAHARARGAFACLPKPFDLQKLRHVLDSALRIEQGVPAPPRPTRAVA